MIGVPLGGVLSLVSANGARTNARIACENLARRRNASARLEPALSAIGAVVGDRVQAITLIDEAVGTHANQI